MFGNKYPYTDFHEINLDWILAEIMKLHHDYDEFKAVNTITNAGAWDITKQYQAWTVVSDNNAGYISLKPVPAGVAISNTEYWGLIADYNILITNLSARISALENAVDNIDNVEIPNILASDKIFLGDSYGVDAQAGGKAWSSYVGDTYPDAYVSMLGGTGFASDLFMSDNWLSMLQALAGSITNKDAVKEIFVFGGANDGNLYYGGTATDQDITDRIQAFCAYAKSTFKNAHVYVGFIGWFKDRSRFPAYKAVRNLYIEGCNLCDNASYIAGIESVMKNDTFINTLDQVHPTFDGSKMLAKYILQAVSIKGNVHYHEIFDTTFTPASGVSMTGMSEQKVIYDGDECRIMQYGNHNTYTDFVAVITPVNFSYGSVIDLGSYTNVPRVGQQPRSTESYGEVVTTGNVTSNKMFSLSQDIDMHIKVKSLNDGTTNNVQILVIPQPMEIRFNL